MRKGFTLLELLVVIATIATLAVVVVLTLNPTELLRQARDSNRLSDLSRIDIAVGLAKAENLPLGNASTVYVSLPDPTLSTGATSTCGLFDLPSLPTGWTYQCSSPENYRNVNGTGWIPIAFNMIPSGSPFGSLPIDPINTSSSYLFYTYTTDGTHYEITAHNESQKYQPTMWNDGGRYTDLYEQGTSLSLLPADLGGGDVYVADIDNGRFEDFTSNGTYLFQTGGGAGGITVNGIGDVYEMDGGSRTVKEFFPNGALASEFYIPYGSGPGQITNAQGIAVDGGGNVYVADFQNDNVQEFSPNGTYLSQFGSAGSGNGQFTDPTYIAINGSGNIYVTDFGNNRVEEFSPNGTYLSQFGSAGSGNGQFDYPAGIAFDGSGDIYVVDTINCRVEEFSPNGTYLSQFGSRGSGNGQFVYPEGIAINEVGDIYVVDVGNSRVEEFSPNGTYLSQFGSYGSGNGQFHFNTGLDPIVVQ